jgi:uncharacterized protein YbcC (UPF0753/DUF2309 family)
MSFVSTLPKVEVVPEKIRLWREETERKLIEKDKQEQEAKEVLRENAKKEMDDFVKKYEDQLKKTKEINRYLHKNAECCANVINYTFSEPMTANLQILIKMETLKAKICGKAFRTYAIFHQKVQNRARTYLESDKYFCK